MEKLASAKRNAIIAYAIEGFENASFSLPIWLLFLTRQVGLSVTAAIALFMTRWITIALCNIPTGALADRFGRAKLYRIGQLAYALSFAPFLITKNIPVLVAAQLLGGFFGSMSIGVLKPLVQDSYSLADIPAKYKHFLSTSTVILYASRFFAGIVGAWLYAKHPYGPYMLEIVVLSSAFVCSLFLNEQRLQRSVGTTNMQHISEALRYVWRHKYLRNFFGAMLFVALAAESIWTGLQPYFIARSIPTQFFGLLFGVVALLSALGAYLCRKIPDVYVEYR